MCEMKHSFFSAVVGMRDYNLIKERKIYYEICDVIQNIIFPEYCWSTASNFWLEFRCIACLISNNSGIANCPGFPETAIRKQSRVFVPKIFKANQKKNKVEGTIQ